MIYNGDEGTAIRLDCGTDISTAAEVNILYEKPSGDTGEWTGTVYNTTMVQYVTTTGDIDEPGEWYLQAYVDLTTWKGYSNKVKLEVGAVIAITP